MLLFYNISYHIVSLQSLLNWSESSCLTSFSYSLHRIKSVTPAAPFRMPSQLPLHTFSILMGYHKNILIKFHIYAQDILCRVPSDLDRPGQTFNCDRNTGIKRSPLIIQITHTSSLPTALSVPLQFSFYFPLRSPLAPFCLRKILASEKKKKEKSSEIIQWGRSQLVLGVSRPQ